MTCVPTRQVYILIFIVHSQTGFLSAFHSIHICLHSILSAFHSSRICLHSILSAFHSRTSICGCCRNVATGRVQRSCDSCYSRECSPIRPPQAEQSLSHLTTYTPHHIHPSPLTPLTTYTPHHLHPSPHTPLTTYTPHHLHSSPCSLQAMNISPDSILLRPAEFYTKHDIEVILKKEVSFITPSQLTPHTLTHHTYLTHTHLQTLTSLPSPLTPHPSHRPLVWMCQ